MKWSEWHHAEWRRKEKEEDTKGSCDEQRHHSSLPELCVHHMKIHQPCLICLEQLMAERRRSNYFSIWLSHQTFWWQIVWNSTKSTAVSIARLTWLSRQLTGLSYRKKNIDTMQKHAYFSWYSSNFSFLFLRITEWFYLFSSLKSTEPGRGRGEKNN